MAIATLFCTCMAVIIFIIFELTQGEAPEAKDSIMNNQFGLLLRVFLLYPLGGMVAMLPSVDFDKAAGLLTIDLSAASVLLGTVIYAAVTGGTFGWSRFIKGKDGAT